MTGGVVIRLIATACSGCFCPLVLDLANGEARSRRGVGAELFHGDGDLITWDCPECGYADSYSAVSS